MVKYWMHNNMITIAGKKMGKSYNNFITLDQFFQGTHELLEQPYSPMTIRFFILQAHYRSTVDFSNEALQASQKGFERLMDAVAQLERITPQAQGSLTEAYAEEVNEKCATAMDDDFNSPIVISHLFDVTRVINQLADGQATITAAGLEALKKVVHTWVFDILGLKSEAEGGNAAREEAYGQAVDLLLSLRAKAKAQKDWATSDQIRDELARLGFEVKDTKDGATWKLNK